MKIIPLYLPQFHQIPENDTWWGEGFTEWTNMKKAMPLFDGHYQPRVPLNKNYYDLTDVEVLKWQSKLAKEHGIYGFCFYHYWFNGKLLLEKPMELLRDNPDIDLKYCISWANENWTNGWVSSNNKILMAHDFDDEEDWIEHFKYLLTFFNDSRYITEDGMPIILIYVPHHIGKLEEMLNLWRQLAIKNGFPGLKIIYQNARSHFDTTMNKELFDYGIEFNPGFAKHSSASGTKRYLSVIIPKISSFIQRKFGIHLGLFSNRNTKVTKTSYDDIWKKILDRKPDRNNMIPTAFVDWDNTPRRKERGEVYLGATPEKFEDYLSKLIYKTKTEYNSDKMFLFAWNEWAEGGYLEPDEKYGYGYLNAVKNALDKNK
ncbi:glycosyl transferase [Vibrio breoganii]|uniref:glycosyltransferase WbsX family protein n=1 Tax=Vibrio breoganii TaxID=553239 RepID=UPI000C83A090|nr:glycoside hydrolase family 99-like domain-containing protein [Vibrio breoganii]PMM86849.1 glycosyl transferase [Vibrio breoganii]